MIVQLHFHEPRSDRTEFVAQGEIEENETFNDSLRAWTQDVVQRHDEFRPEGWCWLVCNLNSRYAVLAP